MIINNTINRKNVLIFAFSDFLSSINPTTPKYTIKNIDSDGHLHVAMRASDGVGFMQPIRVHKTYMINKSELRNIKLNYLFDETK